MTMLVAAAKAGCPRTTGHDATPTNLDNTNAINNAEIHGPASHQGSCNVILLKTDFGKVNTWAIV